MAIWFTSDSHYGHHNIITYCKRPYTSADEMNTDLTKRWNEKVKPEDIVYHLGDFSMSKRGLETIIPTLNGTKILIAGNHDACHPSNKRKGCTFNDYCKLGFSEVALEKTITLHLKGKDTQVKLCHLPYAPSEHEQADRRYMSIRPKDEGTLLLHGHVHTSFKFNRDKKMINVGVDCWSYSPISIADIDKLVTDENFQI